MCALFREQFREQIDVGGKRPASSNDKELIGGRPKHTHTHTIALDP